MKKPFVLIVSGLLMCGSLSASVIRTPENDEKLVEIRQEPGRQWKRNDHACVVRGKAKIACGRVIIASSASAVVQLAFTNDEVLRGDKVEKVSPFGAEPEPVGADEVAPYYTRVRNPGGLSLLERRRVSFDAEYSLGVGLNQHNPLVNFQVVASNHTTVGLLANGMNFVAQDVDAKLKGALLTFNYYHVRPFEGVWAQLGAGYQLGKLTFAGKEVSQGGFSAIGTLGYRFSFSHFSIGAAAGGQFFHLKQPAGADFDVLNLAPTGMAEVSWTF